ncbi:bifunctional diguanylate cyclase/phosphodiesterase [Baekduia soli]|uniref:Bifunctional diguanylate cyclase/phosphodiesterase n=1 Tax=Baekduia soli TaxID=496014 RepID=A0A5B8U2F8_9ACTN|nr:bifunctional diguanylate cyclase/phosphodiesterase [Baekduia soli]QEC47102.1 bifunctional diguanylate cyclase/phosphodiesterase [Baekduia soli]
MSARRPALPLPAVPLLAAVGAGLLLAGVVAGAVRGMTTAPDTLDHVRHTLVLALAAGLIVARAVRVSRDRRMWIAMAAGAVLYGGGLAFWGWSYHESLDTPADLMFFGGDLLFWAGLLIYLRRRVGDALPTFWLDAVGVAVYLGSILTAVLLTDVRDHSGISRFTAAANLIYPAADAALASIPFVVASFSGRRMRGEDILLGATFAVAVVTDTVYVLSLAGHAPAAGVWFDTGWELQLLLLGVAAWSRPGAAGTLRMGGWWESVPTMLLLGVGAGILTVGEFTDLDPVAVGLALLSLAGGVVRSMLMLRDVRRVVVQRREALTDDLTGLPNRRALFRALDILTRDGGRSGERADLLVIDLDGFRELNETLGHEAGDVLLRTAADRLKPVVGDDLLVRLGADEFAAVLRPPADTAQIARDIREAVAIPIELDDVTVAIEASVGVASFPDDANDAGELARRADVATSDAKRRRVGIVRYHADRDEHSRDRLELADDLRRALAARDCGGLWAAFQPQVELATDRIIGAETLIRWHHPQRGPVSPAELLPVAERSGQMAALTDWILDRALSECAGLANQGFELRVGVNVSAVTLVDIGLPERIDTALRRHGVPPARLVVEVTEDAVMNDQRRCLDVLERIAQLGVEISVDDFGTGQSSLAQLRHLPADELKIDRSFVKGMADDPLDHEVVRLVVSMGRSMGLRVVAEGIETAQEREVLVALGCDVAQGFGLGRPMPAIELAALLEQRDAERSRREAA